MTKYLFCAHLFWQGRGETTTVVVETDTEMTETLAGVGEEEMEVCCMLFSVAKLYHGKPVRMKNVCLSQTLVMKFASWT